MANTPVRNRARLCAGRGGRGRNRIRIMESPAAPRTLTWTTVPRNPREHPTSNIQRPTSKDRAKLGPLRRSLLDVGCWMFSRGVFSTARAVALFAILANQSAAQPTPLIHAHAHNDYLHTRPLLDALDHGFCSVEADIYLVEGKLLVAHDRDKVQPDRTLQSLYLDPLRELFRKKGGRVYPKGPDVTLLIDLKSDWQRIYPVLR